MDQELYKKAFCLSKPLMTILFLLVWVLHLRILINAGLAKSTAEGRLKVVFSQFGDVSRGAYFIMEFLYTFLSSLFS